MLRRLFVLTVLATMLVLGGRVALLVAAGSTPSARSAGALDVLATSHHRAAIVLGAGLTHQGTPSPVLRDRIRAGVDLLRRGTVDLLLMTGDNSVDGYSEPSAMRTAALQLGVPSGAIAVDYGGRRTWDSCLRARRVFGVRRAIVVTNDFHRARAVVLCNAAGIEVDGAIGTRTSGYAGYWGWLGREVVASWRGVADAWVHHPTVAVGGRPIDAYDRCAVWASLADHDRDVDPAAAPDGC